MTIQEYNDRLEKFKNKLATFIFKKVAAYAGADLTAQIENRVQQTQKKAKGGKFSTYSTRPMLTSGTTKKSQRVWRTMAGSKEKRKHLDWVTIKKAGKNVHLFELPGGYAEMRRLEGFSNKHKSFEFTGAMWDKFGVTSLKTRKTGFTIKLGGTTGYSQDLINIHSKREGIDIIDVSNKEQEFLSKNVDKWVLECAKQCGL